MKTRATLSALFLALASLWLPTALTAQFEFENIPRPDGGGDALSIGRIGNVLMSAGSGNFFYRSDDNGLTWKEVPLNFSPSTRKVVGLDGKLYVHYGKKVSISSDLGVTWQHIESNITINGNNEVMTVLPSGVLLVEASYQLLRSENQGATWTIVQNLPQYAYDFKFAYDAAKGHIYFAIASGTSAKVARSTDGGKTWQYIYSITGQSLYDISLALAPDGTLFVGCIDDGKIARSKDGGTTWQSIQVATGNTIGLAVEDIAITDSGRMFARVWYQIYQSDNGGDTWQAVPSIWGQEVSDLKNVSGVGLFCRWTGLYRSTDDGATWQFAATGIHSGFVHSIAVQDDNNLFAVTYDGLFSTTDGGISWTARYLWGIRSIFSSPEEANIHRTADGTLYLSTVDTLLRSTDTGISWQGIKPVPNYFSPGGLSVHPTTGQLYYAASYQSLFTSSDRGSTWKLHPNSVKLGLSKVEFSPEDGVYGRNGYGHHFRTNDDFATWDTLKIGGKPATFGLQYGHQGFMLGFGFGNAPQVYRSFDYGTTWDTIVVQQASGLFYNVDNIGINNANMIFAESFWDLGYSVDHGLTWQPIDPQSNLNPYDTKFLISPAQRVYVLDNTTFSRTTAPTSSLTLLGGHVFQDKNKDCDLAPTEPLRPGFRVKAEQGSQTYFGTSNPVGQYLMPAPHSGDWKVSALPPNPLWAGCSATVTVPANPTATVAASVDAGLEALQSCPWMDVSITAPFLRRCFPGQYTLHYCNNGTAPATDAYVEVTLDPFLKFLSADRPLTQTGQLLSIPLGNVAPGQCGTVRIQIEVSCTAEIGQVHCTQAHIYPDTNCIQTLTGARLSLRAECLGDRARFSIRNTGAAMPQPLEYAWNTSDDNSVTKGSFQLGAQQEQSVEVAAPADGRHIYFRHALQAGYPFGTFRSATVSGCPAGSGAGAAAPGVQVGGDAMEPFLAEDCQPNIGSFDPNDKQGFPVGVQAAHHIERTQRLAYLVRFQNTGTDTAFNIVVRDTLSPYLDPATLRLESASHPLSMALSGPGHLAFTFKDILLPDSNINEAASHGWLRYSISPRTDALEGLRVENRAAIYFDFNEPVLTNTTWHTLGLPFEVSGQHTPPASYAVTVQPNPFEQELVFAAAPPSRSLMGARFELLDLMGQRVLTQTVTAEPFRCSTGQLPAGAYLFRFLDEGGRTLGAGKVVKGQ